MADKWIKALLSGALQLDLTELAITGGDLGTAKGSGRITWTPGEGVILHAITDGGRSAFDTFVDSMSQNEGDIIPESQYASVEGFTQERQKIVCRRTLLEGFECHVDSPYTIWKSPLRGIVVEEPDNGGHGVDFVHAVMQPPLKAWPRVSRETSDNPAFPRNERVRDWLNIEGNFGELAARKVSNECFQLKIMPKGTPEIKDLLRAARDSFGFLAGRNCSIRGYTSMVRGIRKDCVNSTPSVASESLYSPLGSRAVFHGHCEHFLAKAVDFFLSPAGVKAAEYLYLYRDTSGTSLATKFAVASICVEGLAKLLNATVPIPSDPPHSSDVPGEFRQWINDNPLGMTDSFVNRLQAYVNGLGNPRPQDVLYKWRSRSLLGLTDDEIKAWSRLRNGIAHANVSIPEDAEQIQAQLRRYDCVVTLMFKIVMQLMGYEGQFLNRGLEGVKEEVFPLAVFSGEPQ